MSDVNVGDILWEMNGTRQNDKIMWEPVPKVVKAIEQHMYRFYGGEGISHNGVGSIMFSSKEECEEHWLKNHSLEEPIGFDEPTPEGINERPRTDWESYEVSKDNMVDYTAVYKGGLTRLENITEILQWHKDTEHVEYYGDVVHYLQLHEISEQLKTNGLITVIENGPLRSKIFQWGNYKDQGWVYLGEIMGYM